MIIINNLTPDKFEKAITKLFLNYTFKKEDNEATFIPYCRTVLKPRWKIEWIELPIYAKELWFVEDHVEIKEGPIKIKIWDGDYIVATDDGMEVAIITRDTTNRKPTPFKSGPFKREIHIKKGNNND